MRPMLLQSLTSAFFLLAIFLNCNIAKAEHGPHAGSVSKVVENSKYSVELHWRDGSPLAGYLLDNSWNSLPAAEYQLELEYINTQNKSDKIRCSLNNTYSFHSCPLKKDQLCNQGDKIVAKATMAGKVIGSAIFDCPVKIELKN